LLSKNVRFKFEKNRSINKYNATSIKQNTITEERVIVVAIAKRTNIGQCVRERKIKVAR